MQSNPIDLTRKTWDNFAPAYTAFDKGPQTFFYTLTSQLKIHKAKNVLEIACGGGTLLPYVISAKTKSAHYSATDLAPDMVGIASARLRQHFGRYESKWTYQEWLENNNVRLFAADGEQPIPHPAGLYDTVICNLVLMLTPDPRNMLRAIHQSTTQDARLGVTIWGDKSKNSFVNLVGDLLKELGVAPNPNVRSPFYLTSQFHDVAAECGWEIVQQWEQTVAFPFTELEDEEEFMSAMDFNLNACPGELKEEVKKRLRKLFVDRIKNREAFCMSNRMYILKKQSKKE